MATQKLSIDIEGMHCGACATGIQMVSEGLDGVEKAFVDFDKKHGEVEFDSDKVKQEVIIAEIAKLGYTATPVS
jgi:copper chaperone CopZ